MYAQPHYDDCTGCTGPAQQACKARPATARLRAVPSALPAPVYSRSGAAHGFPHGETGRDADVARPSRFRWINRLATGLASAWVQAARRRRAGADLSQLDDRTLRDIGISRFEIEAAIGFAGRRGR